MRFFIVAGEASGDLHASNLVKGLKKQDPGSVFSFIGGDLMAEAAGSKPLAHYRDMNFMGLFDVLLNIFRIRRIMRWAQAELKAQRPDAVILVDYAGFNLRLAKFACEAGLSVFYYISPKVWAWRESRVKKMKKYVDRLFVIFPFEVEYFKKHGMDVEYFGNPLADAVAQFAARPNSGDDFTEKHSPDKKPIVALLAGSRKQEIRNCLPAMIETAEKFPEYRFVIAGAPSVDRDEYSKVLGDAEIGLVYNETYRLLSHAKAALVTSGTATLETALFRVPQVVVYKTGGFTYRLGMLFVSFKFFSLVNLILDKELVKEILQFDLARKAEGELGRILTEPGYAEQMQEGYDEIVEKIGKPGSSDRVAARMLALCR